MKLSAYTETYSSSRNQNENQGMKTFEKYNFIQSEMLFTCDDDIKVQLVMSDSKIILKGTK